ncbi:hypothetical protein [Aureimonas sp. AU20]|uniref:hypothetical protein n=1 Tax=Aureimonas sp. AU20 TaxID=1349819 RepID=UPI00071F1997|nr:hypothetical protein [Aureimonas sp. AU20]ALN73513.1 hypothetical protein M673_12385 [Aureimonas sp. AU20]
MEWIASLDFEKIANAIVILLTGFLSAFAFRRGRAHPSSMPTEGAHLEVAGALVDSGSIKALAAAVEGHSLSLVETRATGRNIIESLDELGRRIEQLEEELREHRNEMARHRR